MAQKLTVILSDEVADALRGIAAMDGLTITQAVSRCVTDHVFLQQERRAGRRVLLYDETAWRGQFQEVLL